MKYKQWARQHTGPESEAERLVWQAARYARLPELEGLVLQHSVMRYRLDMAIPQLKIGFEIDGYEWHSDRETFVRDRQRQRQLELAGWRIVRFAGKEAIYEPDQCVRDMASAVRQFFPFDEDDVDKSRAGELHEWCRRAYSVELDDLTEAVSTFDIAPNRLSEISECAHEFEIEGEYSDGSCGYAPCDSCGVDREFLERIDWPLGTIACQFCTADWPPVCIECSRGYE